MNKEQEFKKELKALLEKYKVSIDFECGACSDLHGLYNPKIVAGEWVLSEDWEVEAEDL